MDANDFWNRVRVLIKREKTTQKALAEYLGVPVRTLGNWIYRGLYPVITEGYYIAQFLGVSVDYLVTGKEKKTDAKINSIRSLLKQTDEKLKRM